MPVGEKFVNPYRFVSPNQNTNQNKAPQKDHDCFTGISGRIEAELLTLTPLVVGGRTHEKGKEEEKTFCHDPDCKNLTLIPGSSLKGVIRLLYYLLTGSDEECKQVFGEIESPYRGHVFFTDAKLDTDRSHPKVDGPIITVLSSPKPRHKAFYPTEKGSVKLYHHSVIEKPSDLDRRGYKTKVENNIHALPFGCRFTFSLDLENLADEQLSQILFCLFLPEGLCHKIGGAKPLGAGSVHIRPLKLEINKEMQEYYQGKSKYDLFEGEKASVEINKRCAKLTFPDDVTEMLTWRPKDKNEYRYPLYQWFKHHSTVPLRSVSSIYVRDPFKNPTVLSDTISDLDRRWQENKDQEEEIRKERKREEAEKKKRQEKESRPPTEKAISSWKDDCKAYNRPELQAVYNPLEQYRKIYPGIIPEEFQRTALSWITNEYNEQCIHWKRQSHSKNEKRSKKSPWGKLLNLAKKLKVREFIDLDQDNSS